MHIYIYIYTDNCFGLTLYIFRPTRKEDMFRQTPKKVKLDHFTQNIVRYLINQDIGYPVLIGGYCTNVLNLTNDHNNIDIYWIVPSYNEAQTIIDDPNGDFIRMFAEDPDSTFYYFTHCGPIHVYKITNKAISAERKVDIILYEGVLSPPTPNPSIPKELQDHLQENIKNGGGQHLLDVSRSVASIISNFDLDICRCVGVLNDESNITVYDARITGHHPLYEGISNIITRGNTKVADRIDKYITRVVNTPLTKFSDDVELLVSIINDTRQFCLKDARGKSQVPRMTPISINLPAVVSDIFKFASDQDIGYPVIIGSYCAKVFNLIDNCEDGIQVFWIIQRPMEVYNVIKFIKNQLKGTKDNKVIENNNTEFGKRLLRRYRIGTGKFYYNITLFQAYSHAFSSVIPDNLKKHLVNTFIEEDMDMVTTVSCILQNVNADVYRCIAVADGTDKAKVYDARITGVHPLLEGLLKLLCATKDDPALYGNVLKYALQTRLTPPTRFIVSNNYLSLIISEYKYGYMSGITGVNNTNPVSHNDIDI